MGGGMISAALLALRSFGASPVTWFTAAAMILALTWGFAMKLQRDSARNGQEKQHLAVVACQHDLKASQAASAAQNEAIDSMVEHSRRNALEAAKAIAAARAASKVTTTRNAPLAAAVERPSPAGATCDTAWTEIENAR